MIIRGIVAAATGCFLLLSSCADERGGEDLRSASPLDGIELQVIIDTRLTTEPLGDIVEGDLVTGQRVRAVCFVKRAQGSAGFYGSAIRVSTEELDGFASTSTFPLEQADREPIFDMSDAELAARLEPCD